tara:strand:- start:1623 stop:1907 length:285 start_codon:yes stop_codon:yes gene_type:complete
MSSNQILIESKRMIMTEKPIEDHVKDVAKKAEDKANIVVGPETVKRGKKFAKELSIHARDSVRDAIIAKTKEKAGEAVVGAGKWALSKLLPVKK